MYDVPGGSKAPPTAAVMSPVWTFQVQQSGVFYVQKQCSNLLLELPELIDDVEPHISWMSTALGEFSRQLDLMTSEPTKESRIKICE